MVFKIISFLFPFIGIILYLIKNNKDPILAKKCLKVAVTSMIIQIIIIAFFTYGLISMYTNHNPGLMTV